MKLFNSILVYIHCLCIALIPVYVFGANHTDKNNPWAFFYDGDIAAAMQLAKRTFEQESQLNEKIDAAVGWIQFCKYSSDPYCMEQPFQYLTNLVTENRILLDEGTKKWVETELRHSLVSNILNYERGREIFKENRFEYINYFSVGDGRITNYLNAQRELAYAAREEFETVFAREVVTRLIYRLGKLHETGASDAVKGLVLAQIVETSVAIGDLNSALEFFRLSDDYIFQTIRYLRPHYYDYLYFSAQLLASSDDRDDLEDALLRLQVAEKLLQRSSFDIEMKHIELSMVATTKIFVSIKLGNLDLAYEDFRKHPVREVSEGRVKTVEHPHQLFFYSTALLMSELGVINQIDLPNVDGSIFRKSYRWETENSAGLVSRFARELGAYIMHKKDTNTDNSDLLSLPMFSILRMVELDANPSLTLYSKPPFYFSTLAEYFLSELSRYPSQSYTDVIIKISDALNRSGAHIYGDFLATAPRHDQPGYFEAHTLFDLSSNRLSSELGLISAVLNNHEVTSKIFDSLIKINSSIEMLTGRSERELVKEALAQKPIESIPKKISLVFGYELADDIQLFCVKGSKIYSSPFYKATKIYPLLKSIKGYLGASGSLQKSSKDYPFLESFEIGKLFFGEHFEDCLTDGQTVNFVPFDEFEGLPLSVLTTNPYNGSFRTAPWALKKYPFVYAGSLREAIRSYSDSTEVSASQYLGIANPIFGAEPSVAVTKIDKNINASDFGTRALYKETFLPLPETEKEVIEISQPFSSVDILSGNRATEMNLRSLQLSKYDVINFATHGVLAKEYDGVADPSLVLSLLKKDDRRYQSLKSDGILSAREISNLNLRASVVSLSACNTATQDLESSAKNIRSLASAFKVAGVDNVVSTLWAVESVASKQINSTLFLRWMNTSEKLAESLRKAKLEYLESVSEGRTSPTFWGAIVVLGSGQATANKLHAENLNFKVLTDDEIGTVSGVAKVSNDEILISKTLNVNQEKLAPVLELKNLSQKSFSSGKNVSQLYGSPQLFRVNNRNILTSITVKEISDDEISYAPLISEYSDSGDLIWNYQYPIKEDQMTEIHSVNSTLDGAIVAFLHVSGSKKTRSEHIGLMISQNGEIVKEKLYYSTTNLMAYMESLILPQNPTKEYFHVIINSNLYGNQLLKGDLGESFVCSKPTALLHYVDAKTLDIFATTRFENTWIDSANDTDQGLYVAGAKSDNCRYDAVSGDVPFVGKLVKNDLETIYEDRKRTPGKILNFKIGEDKISFTQIWQPKVLGNTRLSVDEILQDLSFDYSSYSEFEDTTYSFVGIGSIYRGETPNLEFLPINNFRMEGADLTDDEAIIFGRLGMKPALIVHELH